MFDRFEDEAKRSMSEARRAAQRWNHEYIGTEHLLAGMLHTESAGAIGVLARHGITPEQVLESLERVVKCGPSMVTLGQLPFTPRAKIVLERAMEQAVAFGHSWIGTEHLLLGLLDEGQGTAAQTLIALGCGAESLRQATLDWWQTPAGQARAGKIDAANERYAINRALQVIGCLRDLPAADRTLIALYCCEQLGWAVIATRAGYEDAKAAKRAYEALLPRLGAELFRRSGP